MSVQSAKIKLLSRFIVDYAAVLNNAVDVVVMHLILNVCCKYSGDARLIATMGH